MAKKEEKKASENVILEREYIVPLRKKFSKTARYKRARKAVKALKKFIARHMKVPDRDLKKIKIDKYLNEELWFKGIRKPPIKIKVKCRKFEDDRVVVELSELSEKARWKKVKEEKLEKVSEKKKDEKKVEEEARKKAEEEAKKREGEEEGGREEEEKEEKEEAVKEAGLKEADRKAREIKHKAKMKKGKLYIQRKALQK